MRVSGSTHGNETEIKLIVTDAGKVKRKLRASGFRVHRPRVFERNLILDRDGELRRDGTLLRVRQAGKICTLTYKGKAVPGRHKSREELETKLENLEQFTAILAHIGFEPAFEYQKFRTEFKAAGQSGVVTLDETPIGTFLEVEGEPDWIDRTAAELGFPPGEYITESYGTLYLQYAQARGERPGNMVFPGPPGKPKAAKA